MYEDQFERMGLMRQLKKGSNASSKIYPKNICVIVLSPILFTAKGFAGRFCDVFRKKVLSNCAPAGNGHNQDQSDKLANRNDELGKTGKP